MKRERVEKQKHRLARDREELQALPNEHPDREVLDDLDSLLDEIDEVLEENAEEFVDQYIQKGGE